ncbi:hypothetical protein DJ94_5273 [Bacillus pseudomycoides]|nr:hypothetical protein DJ94_5273 [Bacillus pseudomycoides]
MQKLQDSCKKSIKVGHTDTMTLKKECDRYGKGKILDIGTGSGLLIIKLAKTFPKSFLTRIGNIRKLNVNRMLVGSLICILFFLVIYSSIGISMGNSFGNYLVVYREAELLFFAEAF